MAYFLVIKSCTLRKRSLQNFHAKEKRQKNRQPNLTKIEKREKENKKRVRGKVKRQKPQLRMPKQTLLNLTSL